MERADGVSATGLYHPVNQGGYVRVAGREWGMGG